MLPNLVTSTWISDTPRSQNSGVVKRVRVVGLGVGRRAGVCLVGQERHPDEPDVVVTLGAGSIGVAAGSLKLGHFAADRWTWAAAAEGQVVAELFVGGEGLGRGARRGPASLLHEAAHGIAHQR